MTIIDPRNLKLCGLYAEYRRRSRSDEIFKDDWTAEKVRDELLATIAATAALNAEINNVRCEIRFRNSLSQFRFDVSDDHVMVTQEDPQEPAFSYPRGSKFFDYYKRENQLIWDQSDQLDINDIASSPDEVANSLKTKLVAFLGADGDYAHTVERSLAILSADKSPYA